LKISPFHLKVFDVQQAKYKVLSSKFSGQEIPTSHYPAASNLSAGVTEAKLQIASFYSAVGLRLW